MIWGRVHLSPLGINLAKNVVGSLLLFLHLAVLALLSGDQLWHASWESTGWLAISGLVGIVIGDTFFFRSLQILGPRIALMLTTATPFFSIIIGCYVLHEPLSTAAMFGVLLTMTGIAIVVSDRKARKESPGLFPGTVMTGVLCGLGGAFCQSAGAALAKWGMTDCLPLEATFIRTCASLAITLAFVMAQKRLGVISRKMVESANWKFILLAATLGTWMGVWLSQVALKYSNLATATTLMATTPIFALPIVHFGYKQRATIIAVIGSLIGFAGGYIVALENQALIPDDSPAAVDEKASSQDGVTTN